MHIKIYFREKALILCDVLTDDVYPPGDRKRMLVVDQWSPEAIEQLIRNLEEDHWEAGILCHSDFEELREAVWRQFTLVEAAGGLIRNPTGQVLFMLRRGKWDLPKGKRDPGESIQECSLREVREETGLIRITLLQFLLTTRHVYEENGNKYLKETSWFAMSSPGREELVPQLDEQITELRWVSPRKIPDLLANSFPSIREVLGASGIAS